MATERSTSKSNLYIKEFNKANRKRNVSSGRNCIAVPKVKMPKTKIQPTTLEKEKITLQRKKTIKLIKIVTAVIAAVVAMVTCTMAYMEQMSYKPAVKAYIGDTLIGVIHTEEEFYECITAVQQQLSDYLDNEVHIEQVPTFETTKVKEDSFHTTEKIEQNLKSIVNISVSAYAIVVDGEQKGLLKDEEAAYAILEDLKAPFQSEEPNIKVGFEQDVQIEKKHVKVGEIQEQEEVLEILSALEEEMQTYEIKQNDTLWDIALDHKLPVEEILRLNPEINEVIHPGDTIRLSVPKPMLGVETRELVEYNEDIPFEIKEIEDSDLYQGRRTIVEKGLNGEKAVKAEVIRINGIETGKEIIQEMVLAEPKLQTEKVGTKPLPPKYGTGSFRYPLYGTLTSRFGPRWGRMHNGIDIAKNQGSPIYAADGGKVIFAGWLGDYGYLVKIHHDNEYVTYYGHCSKLLVKTGQRVAKGEVIAKVGNTGRSTGPHVHFEVRKNGVPQNPLKYLQ